MTTDEFANLSQKLTDHVNSLLFSKAKEYATEDRLFNFRQMTSLFHTNPAQVALFYQSKHYASIAKMVEDIDKGIIPSEELILEKVGDLVAYAYLVFACLMETKDAKTS